MKVTFTRKKAYPLFFAKVPLVINGKEVASIKNGGEFIYEGDIDEVALLGPGVVRTAKFTLDQEYDELLVQFKIAMGFMAGGFKITIFNNGEIIKKLRKTF